MCCWRPHRWLQTEVTFQRAPRKSSFAKSSSGRATLHLHLYVRAGVASAVASAAACRTVRVVVDGWRFFGGLHPQGQPFVGCVAWHGSVHRVLAAPQAHDVQRCGRGAVEGAGGAAGSVVHVPGPTGVGSRCFPSQARLAFARLCGLAVALACAVSWLSQVPHDTAAG